MNARLLLLWGWEEMKPEIKEAVKVYVVTWIMFCVLCLFIR